MQHSEKLSVDKDSTEHQSLGGQSSSKRLSVQGTTPPAEVPGYRLEQFLGSGAFGQVWTGTDLNTGRAVAVKFCLHRRGVNWSLLSHEVKNLVQLSADRYVVQVLEVGWDSDPPYYIMELVTGGSMEDMLQARGALPTSEAVQLFKKICVGLNHCHGKGVLHCDIKPANILLDQDNEPRLADFGQSRMTHDQTPALGTLFYMAPEQADLESTPDARWDVYAVGAILFRMLTGQPPYRDETIIDQIDTAGSLPKRLSRYRDAISRSSPPAQKLGPLGIDRALSKIVARCLAVDPQQRYANVQQIVEDLDRREASRAKRPLMLLGIVGPILLLLATSIFGSQTITDATKATRSALRNEAFGSNKFVARLAALTLESEIEKYFSLVESEAKSEPLLKQLNETLSDPNVSDILKSIAAAGTSEAAGKMTAARSKLFDASAKKQLDQILAKRLESFTATANLNQPQLASLFITDASGTIVSIAYDKPVSFDANSGGRNYSYRTYFHGGQNDFPRDKPIDSIQMLSQTHLSAAFPSTATGLWKVAISLPLHLDDDQKADAVFVATINLGDFRLPQNEEDSNQIAVLIDAREGPGRGTILQHPLMDKRRKQDISSVGEVYQVPKALMNALSEGADQDYRDPIATADDGKAFAGDWIAAIQPVTLPEDTGSERRADLLVLFQYRLSKVFAPVGVMEEKLKNKGAIALSSIFAVAMAMWFFVRRVNEDKRMTKARKERKKLPMQAFAETMSMKQ